MKCKIHGKKIKITNEISNYAESKVAKLDKYFDSPENLTATIVVKPAGPMVVTEVTVPAARIILRAEEVNKDVLASIDLVFDKIERQIRKNKTRMNKKAVKDKTVDFSTDFVVEKNEEDKSKVAKRKEIELKPMSEEEAILQMNLIDHDFFLYRNAKTGDVELIYKRKDGNYGTIKEK